MRRKVIVWIFLFLFSLAPTLCAQSPYRDTNRFTYGLQRVLLAPLQVPFHLLRGTMRGPLVTGTLGGALTGTFQTVTDLVGGVFDMGASVAPYAKYAIFFI